MTNTTMIFKFDGITYKTTENGYCYAQYNEETAKFHRISKADFEAAYAKYKMMDMTIDEIFEDDTDKKIREELEAILNGTNKPRITEEYVEEATEATETAMETEAVLEAAREAQGQEKPKRKPTKRIPKSVGFRETYDEVEVILTEKQVDFIKHLPDTCYWDNGVDSAIWIDCLCDEIGGQFRGKPMTVGAMISTLCEKGLGKRGKDRMNGRKCTSFALTALGKEVALDLGL